MGLRAPAKGRPWTWNRARTGGRMAGERKASLALFWQRIWPKLAHAAKDCGAILVKIVGPKRKRLTAAPLFRCAAARRVQGAANRITPQSYVWITAMTENRTLKQGDAQKRNTMHTHRKRGLMSRTSHSDSLLTLQCNHKHRLLFRYVCTTVLTALPGPSSSQVVEGKKGGGSSSIFPTSSP